MFVKKKFIYFKNILELLLIYHINLMITTLIKCFIFINLSSKVRML